MIGQLACATFKDALVTGWKAEVSARQMSAALLDDLDVSSGLNSLDLDGGDDWTAGGGSSGNKSEKSSKKSKKKKKKKKKDNSSNRLSEKQLREEEQKLAAEILASVKGNLAENTI